MTTLIRNQIRQKPVRRCGVRGAGALAARSEAANEFLTTKVPQLNVTLKPKAPDAPDEVSDVEEWDEHKGATCHNTNANKCNFLHNASDLAACEAACSAGGVPAHGQGMVRAIQPEHRP